MNADTRTDNIQNIIKNHSNNSGTKRITYKNQPVDLYVYKIPLEYLIFNQYNGRIGTYVQTYQKHNQSIDASTDDGKDLIIKFLWKSNKARNEQTLKDIKSQGQLEIGIITKDGVIIDGNRRCMLLHKLAKKESDGPYYFRTVVLDDKLNDNVKEIRKLETMYQMGVDQIVDYKPIEKYLKCRDLLADFSKEQIANFMRETPADIEKYLNTLELMDDYLKYLGCEGWYTLLEEEGTFADLNKDLKKHSDGIGIHGINWVPNKNDIADLQLIYFDYIRSGLGTHKLRPIGNPSRGKGFFSNKEIWKQFYANHERHIKPINDNEKTVEELKSKRPGENPERIIKARNRDWVKKAEYHLKENLSRTRRELEDLSEANSTYELLQRAKKTLQKIDTEADAFNKNVLGIIKEINSLTCQFQQIIEEK